MHYSSVEDITLKEVLIGVIVVLLLMTFSMFAYEPVFQGLIEREEVYKQALKIDNDPGLFQYGMNTNVGNVLAFGSFESLDNQSIEELREEFSIIVRVKEKYTRHYDPCDHYDDDGNCVAKTTYSWDTVKTKRWHSDKYRFLGVEFDANKFDLDTAHTLGNIRSHITEEYEEYKTSGRYLCPSSCGNTVGNIRYSYGILPTSFSATIFIRFMDGNISNPINGGRIDSFYESKIDSVLETQEQNIILYTWMYYIVWLIVSVGLYLYLAYKVLEIY